MTIRGFLRGLSKLRKKKENRINLGMRMKRGGLHLHHQILYHHQWKVKMKKLCDIEEGKERTKHTLKLLLN